jgi:hypothetical protein
MSFPNKFEEQSVSTKFKNHDMANKLAKAPVKD